MLFLPLQVEKMTRKQKSSKMKWLELKVGHLGYDKNSIKFALNRSRNKTRSTVNELIRKKKQLKS